MRSATRNECLYRSQVFVLSKGRCHGSIVGERGRGEERLGPRLRMKVTDMEVKYINKVSTSYPTLSHPIRSLLYYLILSHPSVLSYSIL
jgi:hypothetical protein